MFYYVRSSSVCNLLSLLAIIETELPKKSRLSVVEICISLMVRDVQRQDAKKCEGFITFL